MSDLRHYTITTYGCKEWLRRTGRIWEGELIYLDANRRLTMADIKAAVAARFAIDPCEMVSARRSFTVSHPRQVAMYLCKQLTTNSLPEIGRRFGDRDHSTVIHAIKQVEKRRAEDRALDRIIEGLERELKAPRLRE
jgi:chromosomal replication initiator protein